MSISFILKAQQAFFQIAEGRATAFGDGGLTAVIDQMSPVVGCGEPVTLTATVSGATEISWKRNGEFITGATTTTFVANQSGIYSVVAVSLLCQLESTPVEVILQSPLNASILTPEGTEACEGEAVPLLATGGNAQWQWYRDGEALLDATSETYVATEAGTYSVVGNENTPCVSTSTPMVIIIHGLPQASLVWESNPVICAGDSLTVLSTNADNLVFSWYWDEAFVSVGANSYVATLAGDYHAVVTDAQTGCNSTTNSVFLEVLPQQEVQISIEGNPWMCEGESAVLLVTAGEGSVQWLAEGMAIEGMTDVFLNVFDGAVYTARITDMNGCLAISNALALDVLPLPNVYITISEGTEILCGVDDTLHLQVEAGNAYVWYAGEVMLENQQGSSLAVTEPGDYFVQVTNSSGCVAISEVRTIQAAATPEALLIPQDGVTICLGQTAVLEVVSAQGGMYTWYVNGEELETVSDALIEVSAPGEYTVLVTDENGCQALSANTTVQTIEVATPVISVGGTTSEGQLLTTDDASGHQWYLNGEMIVGATSSEYLATQEGVYTVISLEDVCESALSEGVEVVLGGVLHAESEGLLVYPNPCAVQLNVVFVQSHVQTIFIYDATGKLVFSVNATNSPTMIDVQSWSTGLYTLVSDAGMRVMVEVVR